VFNQSVVGATFYTRHPMNIGLTIVDQQRLRSLVSVGGGKEAEV